ncbi:MAG: hypothetical protein ACUVR3_08190 [Candidatus Roseilinea sp.]|uniref:hypothetical protein n=1 Tax=Candidatus Roseilinea sp. TaxID=2838777 RepID=UPI00404B51F9
MNTFNRAFTLVGLILLTIFGAATLVAPAMMLSFIDGAAAFFHTSVFGGMTDIARILVRILLAIIFVTVMLVLVWMEIRRPALRTVEVARATGGRIRLTTRDLEEQIRQRVDAISDVLHVKVQVTERDNAVVASLDVEAASDTDLIEKGEEVAAITRNVIQDQYGVKLFNKPQVTIKAARPAFKPSKAVKAPSSQTQSATTAPSVNSDTPANSNSV